MKNKSLLMLLGGLTACFCVSAQAEVTANIAASSNYCLGAASRKPMTGQPFLVAWITAMSQGFMLVLGCLISTLVTRPAMKWICTQGMLVKLRA